LTYDCSSSDACGPDGCAALQWELAVPKVMKRELVKRELMKRGSEIASWDVPQG